MKSKDEKNLTEVPEADSAEDSAPVTEETGSAETAENAEIAAAAAAGVLENGEPVLCPQVADGKPHVYGDKVLTKAQQRKRSVLRWVILIFGIIMMSCSVYFFQTPNDFTLGGIAGIAVILESFIKPLAPFFTQGVIMAIINVALLIIGLIILGKQCTVRTIFCSLFYTAFIWLFEYLDVIGAINTAIGRVNEAGVALRSLTDEPLLELVYAILLFGIGGALVFNCGASSGGTDIIALILKKFTNINVGMALMIIDMIVVLVSFYTFDVDKGLFSVLGLFTKSFLLDGVIESIGKTK